MAILVQSFLNSATKLSTTATTATTVAQLKTLVNALEGSSTATMQFYIVNPSTTATILANGNTLGSYGITTATTIYSSNTISTATSKVSRQLAKLELAQLRRQAGGNTSTSYYRSFNIYSVDLLADKYTSNTSTVGTTSTLAISRPWTTTPPYSAGVYKSIYGPTPTTWTFNTANTSWIGWSNTPTSTAVATNFDNTFTAGETQRAIEWRGYFLPSYTGVHTFSSGGANVDDCLTLWIGASALTGYTTGNAVFNASLAAASGTISLTAGTYYPIRVQHGNNSGPGAATIYYAHTGQTTTKVYTGKLFYNPATNGF